MLRSIDKQNLGLRATCSAAVSCLFFVFKGFLSDQLSQSPPNRFFDKIFRIVELWLWIISLKLVFLYIKGRCRGNQFLLVFIYRNTRNMRFCAGRMQLKLGFALYSKVIV